jgi:hypothetical protein
MTSSGSFVSYVTNFNDLVRNPLVGNTTACGWLRQLEGDFAEIIQKINPNENLLEIDEVDLLTLSLSKNGEMARQILLNDLKLLRELGAQPSLNIIKQYDRDEVFPFFPTDVYSFHVDASTLPNDTFLCTYYGASSEIVSNFDVRQKVLIPEIRAELKKHYSGPDAGFDDYLKEHFFDLHYQAKPGAEIISLGLGNMWRLAGEYPNNPTLPCIHRAPEEKGEYRLMVIC